ncbi:MAG: serine/threonine protein kinase [Planctomycetota bacterium]|jgi:serine/threonine protein kinase
MTSGIIAIPLIIIGALAIPFLVGICMYHGFRLFFLIISRVVRLVSSILVDCGRLVASAISLVLCIPLIMISLLFLRTESAKRHGSNLGHELIAIGSAAGRILLVHPLRLLGIKVGGKIETKIDQMPMTHPDDLDVELASSRKSSAPDKFEGFKVIGTLPRGGSGARLFVAEPVGKKAKQLEHVAKKPVGRVVIKSFSLEDGSTMPQIVRESRALEAARDLGLVFEHELTGSRFHYVMPYVPGEDLAHVTRDLHEKAGPVGLDANGLRAALSYFAELLVTVERFHAKGLWHKDIKPSNVIVSKGRVHLVDLGLVTPLRSAMTLTTHGTEYFRDPEMVRLAMKGVKVHEVDGVKFDLYSAGALLYSMLENSFPAHGSLSRFSRRVPECLQWIVRRSMADLPKRYSSAVEMLADLQVVLDSDNPLALRPGDLPSMQGQSMSFVGWDAGSDGAAFRSHGFDDNLQGRLRKVGERLEGAGERVRSRGETLSRRFQGKVHHAKRRIDGKADQFESRANRPRKRNRIGLVATLLLFLVVLPIGGAMLLGVRPVGPLAVDSWTISTTSKPVPVPTSPVSFSYEVYNEFGEVVNVTSSKALSLPVDLRNLPAGASANYGGLNNPTRFPVLVGQAQAPKADPSELLAPLKALNGNDKVLLLNTLPATFHSDGVSHLILSMQSLDFEIVGLGDGVEEIDMLARARQELGFGGPEDTEALDRLEDFLLQVESSDEIDAILWLGKSNDGEAVIGHVIGMEGSAAPGRLKGLDLPAPKSPILWNQ